MVKTEKNGTILVNMRRRRSKTGQREEIANDVAHICSPSNRYPNVAQFPKNRSLLKTAVVPSSLHTCSKPRCACTLIRRGRVGSRTLATVDTDTAVAVGHLERGGGLAVDALAILKEHEANGSRVAHIVLRFGEELAGAGGAVDTGAEGATGTDGAQLATNTAVVGGGGVGNTNQQSSVVGNRRTVER